MIITLCRMRPVRDALLIVLVFIGVCAFPSLLFSQSNAVLDELIVEDPASFGKTAYLVLTAADIIPEAADEKTAVAEVSERGWNRKGKNVSDPIKLGEFSYMAMQAFDIKGGLLYSLFPSPRYAARELGFKGYIVNRPGPYRDVSGREVMLILGRISREQEETR